MQQFTNPHLLGWHDRVALTPAEAGAAVFGWTPQTVRNRLCSGTFPLPLCDVGGKKVVTVAAIAAALGLDVASGPALGASHPTTRRGRPSAAEVAEAARRGVSVSALRRGEGRP